MSKRNNNRKTRAQKRVARLVETLRRKGSIAQDVGGRRPREDEVPAPQRGQEWRRRPGPPDRGGPARPLGAYRNDGRVHCG